MGTVDIDPKILGILSDHLSDIEIRAQDNISDTCYTSERLIRIISEEIWRRQRRVEDLKRQYEAARRNDHSDCDELRRMLEKAQRSLDVANAAKCRANAALSEYRIRSNGFAKRLGNIISAGKLTLKRLENHLDDYSAFNGLVLAPLHTGALASPGIQISRSLDTTGQSYQKRKAWNREVFVFDHPERSAKNAVINQGSAYPDSIEGTCGLSALGSLLRKAGVTVTEKNMVSYAVAHGLCQTGKSPDQNGGTSPDQLVSLLCSAAGISAVCDCGRTLEELASAIENGHGVIIGVNPSIFNSEWYGEYNHNDSNGHWIVLESVVRDANSGEILGYVILDSNGESPRTACQAVSASLLEDAYGIDGAVSVVTTDIIW